MEISTQLDVARFPIGTLYEWLSRKSQRGTKVGGNNVLVRCILPAQHKNGDQDPSLKLNLEDNVFVCFGCHIKGGNVDLITAAGVAANRSERSENERALGWLKDQLGIPHATRLAPQPPSTRKRRKIDPNLNERVEDIFRYTDEHGELLYTILKIAGEDKRGQRAKRFEAYQPAKPMRFAHERIKDRRPYPLADGTLAFTLHEIVGAQRGEVRWELVGSNGVTEHVAWHVRGVRIVPYNLPAVVKARHEKRVIFFPEGETDADTLTELGFVATCTPFGSSFKLTRQWQRFFKGAGGLLFLADADLPGRKRAFQAYDVLHDCVPRAAIMDPFLADGERKTGYDITDYRAERRAAGDDDTTIRRAIERMAADALRDGPIPESVRIALTPLAAPATVDPQLTLEPATGDGLAASATPPSDTADLRTSKTVTPTTVRVSASPLTHNAHRIEKTSEPAARGMGTTPASAPGTALVPVHAPTLESLFVALIPRSGGTMRVVPLAHWETRPLATYRVSKPMSQTEAVLIDPATYPWLEPDQLTRLLPRAVVPA